MFALQMKRSKYNGEHYFNISLKRMATVIGPSISDKKKKNNVLSTAPELVRVCGA